MSTTLPEPVGGEPPIIRPARTELYQDGYDPNSGGSPIDYLLDRHPNTSALPPQLQPAMAAPGPYYSYATPTGARPGSTLADMLQAAGMYPVSPDLDPAMGYQYAPPQGADYASRVEYGTPSGQPNFLGSPKIQGDERVYMGHEETIAPSHVGLAGPTDAEMAGEKGYTKHKTMSVAQAANLPYMWYDDPEKLDKLQKNMRQAGFSIGASGNALGDTVSAWTTLVQQAAAIYDQTKGKTLVTPWDLLAQQKKYNIANGNVDANGNVTSVSRSRSVNDLTEGQAWGTLRATMQSMLGRDPTDQEVRDFLSAANADAARDPSVSVTTTKTNSETGRSRSNTVTHGGYTADDAAKSAYEDLHNDADYGAYQASTTYFNAMLSALGEVAGSS